ncbi:MAG: hypothetical protein ACE5JF_07900 [Anaerolineales bacterium]
MKRQIHEITRVLGLNVERIIRVRIANLAFGDLDAGAWRHLTDQETEDLRFAMSEPVEVR